MTTTEALLQHHKHCDDLFATVESLADAGKWPECAAAQQRFCVEMAAHFATEEQTLFPAFEAATGSAMGPTQVMRMEHAQMTSLLDAMTHAVAAQDAVGLGGNAETLLIMMQQHNMKEENILYPMCDRALSVQPLALADDLAARVASACR